MVSLVGKDAPDFKLPDQDGKVHSLKDYTGKYVLLYFYPKDMTSGCTKEAQGFRDNLDKLKKMDVVVLGVSKDPVEKHKKFEEKENLNFSLLSDEEGEVVEKYGVWVEKSMYGKKYMGIQRDSFLIGRDGKVLKHYVKVKAAKHPEEVVKDVGELE